MLICEIGWADGIRRHGLELWGLERQFRIIPISACG